MKNYKKLSYFIAIGIIGVLSVFQLTANAYSGGSPNIVVEGDYIVQSNDGGNLGAIPGSDVYFDITFHDNVTFNDDLTLGTGDDLTLSSGDLYLSAGVASISGETATSTLVEDVLTITRTSGTGYGTDAIGSGFLFKAYDSNGNATNTARISVTLDDVTSGSDETAIHFEQLLDNGIALTEVFELDSGDAIFNTNDLFVDYSTNRVGIQNAAPTQTLDVTGTMAVSGETIFAGNVVLGGATTTITATTSAGDLLLTAAQICNGGNEIELEAGIEAGAFTVTLPTAALLAADCLGTNGSKTIWIDNNSGDNATITAGTGGDLLEGDGLNVVIGTANQAKIEIQMHTNGTAYRAAVSEWQDAD